MGLAWGNQGLHLFVRKRTRGPVWVRQALFQVDAARINSWSLSAQHQLWPLSEPSHFVSQELRTPATSWWSCLCFILFCIRIISPLQLTSPQPLSSACFPSQFWNFLSWTVSMFCQEDCDVWVLGTKSNKFNYRSFVYHGSKEFERFWVGEHIYGSLILESLWPKLPTILPSQAIMTTDPVHQHWKIEQLPLMELKQTSERSDVPELGSRIEKWTQVSFLHTQCSFWTRNSARQPEFNAPYLRFCFSTGS